ncbi:venom protease-like isoform X2 [Oratosquilla oratoria]|uniref:venom protease-like isoform X2 n=1 Tax=Oratosquilla oratoria TaxID=337810 RepID=UPI003F767398
MGLHVVGAVSVLVVLAGTFTQVKAPASLTDVSPPAVNFDCGKSSVKPVTRNRVEDFVTRSLAVPDVRSSFPEDFNPVLPEVSLTNTATLVFAIPSFPNTWPWMALLGYKSKPDVEWVCDGVLINDRWTLTAAHCTIKRFVEVVRLGEHNLLFTKDSPHEDFGVLDTVFHPEYHYPQGYHDLALLKLDRIVVFNFAISPICLPWGRQPTPSVGSLLSLTGWGRTSFGGARSNELEEATVYILDRQKCVDGFSSLLDYTEKYPKGFSSDLLCIGDTDGEGQDACQGDSGGPVMYLKDDRYFLTGVVSLGYGCGKQEFPGLYASVHHAPDLAWIKRVAF